MIAKYDVLFQEKVCRAAERLVANFGYDYMDSVDIARLVLLAAMEVEANDSKRNNP